MRMHFLEMRAVAAERPG